MNDYWINKERDHDQKWIKKMSVSKIIWMSRKNFWKKYKEIFLKKNRCLNRFIDFPIDLKSLREKIKEPPVFTPVEENFSGPVERWYGEIDKNLFILTYFYHEKYTELTAIKLEDDDNVEEIIVKALKQFKEINIYD